MKNNSIRNLLGVTQENMAMLLNITRSQWSLFGLGKRDLPLEATLKLTDMLQFAQKAEKGKKIAIPEPYQETIQKELHYLLSKNEFQYRLLLVKIAALEKKHLNKVRALQLVDFIAETAPKKKDRLLYLE